MYDEMWNMTCGIVFFFLLMVSSSLPLIQAESPYCFRKEMWWSRKQQSLANLWHLLVFKKPSDRTADNNRGTYTSHLFLSRPQGNKRLRSWFPWWLLGGDCPSLPQTFMHSPAHLRISNRCPILSPMPSLSFLFQTCISQGPLPGKALYF